MKQPLVSVIVPTKNSSEFLDLCLSSIRSQTYKNIELIVVDNFSTDSTEKIARTYRAKYYQKGPERSAQVNYGVEKAKGEYVYKVDSDFVLDKYVVRECVDEVSKGFDAVIVHNTPDDTVSWIAKIRKFEVDMYKYDITHSSARFVRKGVYQQIGGFNPEITAGEDYDFQNKLNRAEYKTAFIDAEALHLGEPRRLLPHLRKFFEYGKDFINYKKFNHRESKLQLKFRRGVYMDNLQKLYKQPIMSVLFLIYSFMKFLSGGLGFFYGSLITKKD